MLAYYFCFLFKEGAGSEVGDGGVGKREPKLGFELVTKGPSTFIAALNNSAN